MSQFRVVVVITAIVVMAVSGGGAGEAATLKPYMMLVDCAGNGYIKSGLNNTWLREYGNTNAKDVAVNASGRIFIIDGNNNAFAKDGLYGPWVKEVEGASAVAVGSTGRMMVRNFEGDIYAKDTLYGKWIQETDNESVNRFAVGGKGRMMLINTVGDAYQKDTLTGAWIQQTSGGGAGEIAVSSTGRMMVQHKGGAFVKDEPYGGWVREYTVPDPSFPFTSFAIGGTGRMMVVDANHAAYYKDTLFGQWIKIADGVGAVYLGSTGRMAIMKSQDSALFAKDSPSGAWVPITVGTSCPLNGYGDFDLS